ncbi:MAG: prepilin signal peptidase PulO-like peptidase [Planctomycetota bacterium]|nr:prepilin signal peptidase PulO-like peptidase [Planctomycetota bacterium]
MIEAGYILGGLWVFALGATVGSFANVCIYRIPFQKSLIWPGSHCPRCYSAISARDNVPVLGWILLGGRCRSCSLPIPARYPLIEFLSGALFVAVYFAELVYGGLEPKDFSRAGYHFLLISFLIVATFIDYDYRIIPDAITVTGMIVGLGLGTLMPWARPSPLEATTAWEGFRIGITGLLVGGGIIWAIRIFGRILFRKEAMGFGDVTLMAMIGSFLGWQILPPAVFLAVLLGLIEPLVKSVRMLWILIVHGKFRPVDSEIPFGPYLSMASLLLTLGWPWVWKSFLANYYRQLGEAASFLWGAVGG